VEFRVLGPLEAVDGGEPLPLGAAKQRAVLALLLLQANRVVPRDRLVDGVWGGEPPETATTALQGYVSGLRKALGSERLRTQAPGYVLEVEPGTIDLRRFETLAAEGRAELALGRPEVAVARLDEAMTLWRGEPFADLDPTLAFVASERRRLDELRLGVVEDRIDARLATGRDGELVPELLTLVRDEPFRERPRGQLMLALYRSGRHSEALEAYVEYRRVLRADLGLEPSAELQQLQHAILEQDPRLGPPRPADEGRLPRRSRFPARAVLGIGVVALLAAGAALAFLTRDSSAVSVRPNSIAIVDPVSRAVVGSVAVDGPPVDIVYGFGGAWVAGEDGTITRLSPRGEIVARIAVGGTARGIAVGYGSVWVAGGIDGTVTRIDPARNAREETIRLGPPGDPVMGIAAGPQGIWAIRATSLYRIDPANDSIVARTRIPPVSALAVRPVAGSVWLVGRRDRLLEFVPSLDSTVGAMELGGGGASPVTAANAVWLLVYVGRGEVWRVDRIDAPPQVLASGSTSPLLDLAVDRRAIWTVDASGTLVRRDRLTGRVSWSLPTAPTVRSAVTLGGGRVWVAIQQPL
jgi:DNA-binding SARP family transcriptional activator